MDAIILLPVPLSSLVVVVVMAIVADGGSGGLVASILLLLLVLLLLLLVKLVQGLVLVMHIVGGSWGSIGGCSIGGCHIGGGTVSSRGRMVVLSGCSDNNLVWLGMDVGVGKGLTVYDGIETVDRVGCVLDGATEAIGIVQGVFTLHNIAITRLYLALGITRDGVLHIVCEVVLGMRIIGVHLVSVGVGECVGMGVYVVGLLVDHMLGLWCCRCSVVQLWLLVLLQLNDSSRDSGDGKRDESEQLLRKRKIM